MTTFDQIRRRARSIASRRDDNLGPDRGTMDQEQARIERAKQEARRKAKRERVQQRAQQARQEERQRVLNGDDDRGLLSSITSTVSTAANAVSDNDGETVDDVRRAMGTDFDGDGQPLADELGLQSARRADAEDQKIGAIEDLANDNANRIGSVENDLDALSPQSRRSRDTTRRNRDTAAQSPPDLDFAPDEFDPDFDDFGGGL
jgi:hypothetical protein